MDKTKVKLAISALWRELESLDKAIAEYDHRQIGAQLGNLRRDLYVLQTELGIVRDLAELKPDPPQE